MRFVIVTGMSGAGKSSVLKMLEDDGYFCADNLPVPLILKFAQIVENGGGEFDKIAIGVDVRSGNSLSDIDSVLSELTKINIKYEILFLDASDETLVKRYKETRRSHPLSGNGRVEDGIKEERKRIEADYEKAALRRKEFKEMEERRKKRAIEEEERRKGSLL